MESPLERSELVLTHAERMAILKHLTGLVREFSDTHYSLESLRRADLAEQIGECYAALRFRQIAENWQKTAQFYREL